MNKLHIELWNEWQALFDPKRYNWISFTPIYIYFEWYRAWGQIEFTFVFLGFGMMLTYDLGETKLRKKIYKRIRKIKKSKEKNKK